MTTDFGSNGLSTGHTGDETLEEGLVRQVFIVLFEVLFGRSAELHGGKLVSALLKARNNVSDESTLSR